MQVPRGNIYDHNGNLMVSNKLVMNIIYKNNEIDPFSEIELAYKISDYLELDYNKLTNSYLKDFYILTHEDEINKRISKKEYDDYKNRIISSNEFYNLKKDKVKDIDLSIYNDLDKKAIYLYYLMNNGYSHEDKIIKSNCTMEEFLFFSENNSNLEGFNTKYTYEREYLYGDILRIKEILKEIVKGTVDNIKEGYIKVKLEVIIDDNVCRLIINIKDNGKGYKFKEIEESLKNGIFKKYIDDLNKVNGSFVINSEVNNLTEKIVVIDQLISLKEDKKLEKLEKSSFHKKVMIVDNSKVSDDIVKIIKKYDIEYERVSYGVDCLNKIRNYEKCDLIIINEEIEPLNGIETYKKLKETINFKIPVIMLSTKKDFKVKETYLQLGINDIASIPIVKDDFVSIVDKYLK